MPILTKEVEVKPNGKMIKYYRDLGYDAKYNKSLLVKVEDLPSGSEIKVEVLCDYCNKTVCFPQYRSYYRIFKKFGNYACHNCSVIHQKKSYLEKYGVDSPAKSEEVLSRMKETSLKRYGTEYPMQNNAVKMKYEQSVYKKYGVTNVSQSIDVQRKREQTFIKHYNTTNPFGNKEILEKISNTLRTKYGVTSPLQIPEAKEKAKKTFLRNYGFDNPNKSPEIRAKTAKTLYENSTTPTSRQQLYVFNLYKSIDQIAELNYPISHYNADICLLNEKMDIEYDGGFHDGNVQLGKLIKEEFDRKELIREKIIKSKGYKIMRIKSKTDKLPSDQILLQMLEEAKQYFSNYPNHSWIEFNIDTSTVRNAEHKDGIAYNFGKLRKIKDSDLTDNTKTRKGRKAK